MSEPGDPITEPVQPHVTRRDTAVMVDWHGLHDALATVPDRVTHSWTDLDALVGGLPSSAYKWSAFWSGKRSKWPGIRAFDVRI